MWKFVLIFIFHGLFLLAVLDIFFKSSIYSNLTPVSSDIKLSDIRGLSNIESVVSNRLVLFVCDGLPADYLYETDEKGISKAPFISNLTPVSSDIKLSDIRGLSNIESVVSNRLVLFVCDGLPADYLYETDEKGISKAPFIRSLIEEEGSWGLSFTRVPTESRPGHVALIAGFYEDPSAIFWGWKDNPVTFDTIFNQSDATYSWGCEDILNIFEKRTSGGRFKAFKYPSEWQDYSGNEGTAEKLDAWVEEDFKEFISRAKLNVTLMQLITRPKTVFFFHLLGIDVAGHAYKPKTKFYNNSIKHADEVIKHIVSSINEVFPDRKTSFLLTSDHGMTDWGSHGASSPIETITPIIAWGTGLRKPIKTHQIQVARGISALNRKFESTPQNWRLNSILRHDMNQADISVLMSILLGISIPVNSLGVLPSSVLAMPPAQISIAYYTNAIHLLQQLSAKEESLQKHLAKLFFQPYEPLSYDKKKNILHDVRNNIANNNLLNATLGIEKLILLALDGMDYYDNYFKTVLLSHLFLGFFSVAMIIIGKVLESWNPWELKKVGLQKSTLTTRKMFFNGILFCEVTAFGFYIFGKSMLHVMKCLTFILNTVYILLFNALSAHPLNTGIADVIPNHYLVYFLASLILVQWSVIENPWYLSLFKLLWNQKFILKLLIYLFGIQLMVLSFFHREVLSIGVIAFGLWPFMDRSLNAISLKEKYTWLIFCLILAIFHLFPIVDKKEIFLLRFIVGVLWLLKCVFGEERTIFLKFHHRTINVRMYLACFAICNKLGIFLYFSYGISVLWLHQFFSFVLLVFLLGTMKLGTEHVMSRFAGISFSVGMSFLLFSLSYEALFPLILSKILTMWIQFENIIHTHQFQAQDKRCGTYISHEDIRRCFIYIFLVFVAFFGIGNLSSINSFNTDWLKGFVTTFLPFVMMALIILRTVILIFLVTCAFKFIIFIINVGSKPLFYVVLLFCDIVAAELLLTVQNVGSWLEIGTSLTRFIIMECIVLFLFILYCVAELVTGDVATSSVPASKTFLPSGTFSTRNINSLKAYSTVYRLDT